MVRFIRLMGLVLAWIALLGLSAWAVAALYVDLPHGWQIPLAFGYVALLGAMFYFVQRRLLGMGLCLVGFDAVLIWWLSLSPTNGRQWQSDVDRTAWAEISGNSVTVHNVRNFDYRTEMDYQPRWETRTAFY